MKICILAYWYEPMQAVGALRAESFYKYASDSDVDAFVVTVEPNTRYTTSVDKDCPNDAKIFRIPGFNANAYLRNLRGKPSKPVNSVNHSVQSASPIKKFLYYIYRQIICYPDTHFLWPFMAKKKLKEIIEKEKPDVILTTAFPVSSFILGKYIKKKFPEIKWVADYRDLWSEHQWVYRPWPLSALEKRLEKRTVKAADLILTTSSEFQKQLRKLFPGQEIPIIYNGYDEAVNDASCKTQKFTISYTGILYEEQKTDLFFSSLRELIDDKKIDSQNLQIDFYGKSSNDLFQNIDKYKLDSSVNIHGMVEREKVIKAQRESNILLVIRWDDGPLHVKVFEYLSARVPILAMVKAESEIAQLVNEAHAGQAAEDKNTIKEFILQEYVYWEENGTNRLIEKSDKVDEFSRSNQAKNLYNLLKEL
ncbi:MAG: glycosyltransferase [Lentisphaeria bacterium]|nr:glycosyltransferase [Lentisphaeria bacterium]NQZ69784.1 glycosyltransferase [Lentisphaeria bacterium]